VRSDGCRACVGGPFQRRGGATRHIARHPTS
jgi:hypothetical protein